MKESDLARLLPGVFQRTLRTGGVLEAFVGVMSGLMAPDEQVLAGLHRYFGAYTAPDAFVTLLAHWGGLHHLLEGRAQAIGRRISATRLRMVVESLSDFAKWRGTRRGLEGLLRMATGESITVLDQARPYCVQVVMPASARGQVDQVAVILEQELPASVVWAVVDEDGVNLVGQGPLC